MAELVKDLIGVQHEYMTFGVLLGTSLDTIGTYENDFSHNSSKIFIHILDHFMSNFAEDVWFTKICDALYAIKRKDLALMVTNKYIAPRGNL